MVARAIAPITVHKAGAVSAGLCRRDAELIADDNLSRKLVQT
jgi:hypothetical protein